MKIGEASSESMQGCMIAVGLTVAWTSVLRFVSHCIGDKLTLASAWTVARCIVIATARIAFGTRVASAETNMIRMIIRSYDHRRAAVKDRLQMGSQRFGKDQPREKYFETEVPKHQTHSDSRPSVDHGSTAGRPREDRRSTAARPPVDRCSKTSSVCYELGAPPALGTFLGGPGL